MNDDVSDIQVQTTNPQLQLAKDFVRQTGENLFLTGKAGTGKTTFLRDLENITPKRLIVTAPTGIAAINAGGVTLHSFFQLPFGPFLPGSDTPKHTQQRWFNKDKINIIKSLDLLVIDEISMVRADLLDGVDAVLRRYRHRDRPFGGVQLLMIGDLHQLPPVVRPEEWSLLEPHYGSCYFFSSNALKQAGMVTIELQDIYRQSDPGFIELLNLVRDNELDSASLQQLNSRCIADFQPDEKDDYITLTTHNRGADAINDRQMQALAGKSFTFTASLEGDFPQHNFPTAEKLTLKEGAQVMFVRNDMSGEKRYFNGRIGKVVEITRQRVVVKCPDDGEVIHVEPVEWENTKYTVDKVSGDIASSVVGKFQQYPLRLAWAITIHKSQGLTFEHAVIDASASFAHGQVYVALSRCKSFEGMVLTSPVSADAIITDPVIVAFTSENEQTPASREQLDQAVVTYQQKLILECFDYQALSASLRKLVGQLRTHSRLLPLNDVDAATAVEDQINKDVVVVAGKFNRQLHSMFKESAAPQSDSAVQQRIQKASYYFSTQLNTCLLPWVNSLTIETDNKEVAKQLNRTLDWLRRNLLSSVAALKSCANGFHTESYLKALAHAEIELGTQKTKKSKADSYNLDDLRHPELFRSLQSWRSKQAQEESVEHYRIIHQRLLVQIAETLPGTRGALLGISGIGPRTVEKYGNVLLGIVSAYSKAHDVETSSVIEEPAEKRANRQDTKWVSYELYKSGKSIDAIATERGLKASTIEGHLAFFVGTGDLDVRNLLSDDRIATIRQVLESKGVESLTPAKEFLGDGYSYGELRFVRESMQNNHY